MANQIEVKGKDGKTVGKHSLSAGIAEAAPLMSVIHRAVVAENANRRQGTQSAKTRSEVRGGGRKPYKQKKTGNARQGTIRAPHYAHGGMAFAVKPRDYDKKVNRKERRAALVGALSAQIEAGNVVLADKILFTEPKTKNAVEFLKAMGVSDAKRVLVVLPVYDDVTYRCFRNLPNVVVRTAPSSGAPVKAEAPASAEAAPKKSKAKKEVESAGPAKTATFSTRDVLVAHKVVIAQDAMSKIEEVWA